MSNDPESTVPQVSEQALLNDARELVDAALIRASSGQVQWAHMLQDALAQLTAAFERHAEAAEGDSGTLQVVLERRPALEHAVRIQRRQHKVLLADLQEMEKGLAAAIADGSIDPDTFRWQVAPLQDEIRRHMGRANDLLSEAFDRDTIGPV